MDHSQAFLGSHRTGRAEGDRIANALVVGGIVPRNIGQLPLIEAVAFLCDERSGLRVLAPAGTTWNFAALQRLFLRVHAEFRVAAERAVNDESRNLRKHQRGAMENNAAAAVAENCVKVVNRLTARALHL